MRKIPVEELESANTPESIKALFDKYSEPLPRKTRPYQGNLAPAKRTREPLPGHTPIRNAGRSKTPLHSDPAARSQVSWLSTEFTKAKNYLSKLWLKQYAEQLQGFPLFYLDPDNPTKGKLDTRIIQAFEKLHPGIVFDQTEKAWHMRTPSDQPTRNARYVNRPTWWPSLPERVPKEAKPKRIPKAKPAPKRPKKNPEEREQYIKDRAQRKRDASKARYTAAKKLSSPHPQS